MKGRKKDCVDLLYMHVCLLCVHCIECVCERVHVLSRHSVSQRDRMSVCVCVSNSDITFVYEQRGAR